MRLELLGRGSDPEEACGEDQEGIYFVREAMILADPL